MPKRLQNDNSQNLCKLRCKMTNRSAIIDHRSQDERTMFIGKCIRFDTNMSIVVSH